MISQLPWELSPGLLGISHIVVMLELMLLLVGTVFHWPCSSLGFGQVCGHVRLFVGIATSLGVAMWWTCLALEVNVWKCWIWSQIILVMSDAELVEVYLLDGCMLRSPLVVATAFYVCLL